MISQVNGSDRFVPTHLLSLICVAARNTESMNSRASEQTKITMSPLDLHIARQPTEHRPWANRQPTNHVCCRAKCTVGQRVFRCACLFFSPDEAGLRECLSQDRRGRARTLPTHQAPTMRHFQHLRSIPRGGDREGWRLWEVVGLSGSSTGMTKTCTTASRFRRGGRRRRRCGVPSEASNAQGDFRNDNA